MFWRKKGITLQQVGCDLHSHLIPEVDDGVASLEEAAEAVRGLAALGYRAAVTTPHIWSEHFDNREADLRAAFARLQSALAEDGPEFQGLEGLRGFRLALGAEYMLDEVLLDRLYHQPQDLLTFGGPTRFLLVEFHPVSEPVFIDELLDECRRQGLRPIIAHVERYSYVRADRRHERVEGWRERGALAQVNLGSLVGQFGPGIEGTARGLLKAGRIDLLGSDLHRPHHAAKYLARAWRFLERKGEKFDPSWHQRLLAAVEAE